MIKAVTTLYKGAASKKSEQTFLEGLTQNPLVYGPGLFTVCKSATAIGCQLIMIKNLFQSKI
jgi:hypothetical protein